MIDKKQRESLAMRYESAFSFLAPLIAILISFVIGGIIIACLGKNPLQGYALLFSGSLGNAQKIASSLISACPLIFTSLAAAFAYKCGVFNLGGEGQFIMGAVASVTVALTSGVEGVPGILLCILAGTIAGAVWAPL